MQYHSFVIVLTKILSTQRKKYLKNTTFKPPGTYPDPRTDLPVLAPTWFVATMAARVPKVVALRPRRSDAHPSATAPNITPSMKQLIVSGRSQDLRGESKGERVTPLSRTQQEPSRLCLKRNRRALENCTLDKTKKLASLGINFQIRPSLLVVGSSLVETINQVVLQV